MSMHCMRRPVHLLTAALGLLASFACGDPSTIVVDSNVPTASLPLIARIAPTSGSVGSTVSLFGLGFSVAPEENIIFVGTSATSANTYTLTGGGNPAEIEEITFTVPGDLVGGTYSVFVEVLGNPSNADMSFAVTP